MNILFITPSLPNRLHRNRAFCIIKTLSKDHNVHLISLAVNKKNDPSFDEIKKFCTSYEIIHKPLFRSLIDCLLFFFSSLPLEVAYCRSPKIKKRVTEITEEKNIDLIYVKRLRSVQFVNKNTPDKVPVLIDTTDAMSLFYQRAAHSAPWYKKIFYIEEYFKYSLYEKYVAQFFTQWVTCSDVDRLYLSRILPNIHISIVPNTVDTEYYSQKNVNESYSIPTEKHSIIISGLMNKFVNTEAVTFFVKEIFPLVQKEIPDTTLYIVGPNPTKKVRRYANKQIIITGYVSDIRKYIKKAYIVACPVKTGAGTRNKIVQAWSLKKPVVTTSLGIEGLNGNHGVNAYIADNPLQFAEHITKLMKDEQAAQYIALNGYKHVKENYSHKALEKSLHQVFVNIK